MPTKERRRTPRYAIDATIKVNDGTAPAIDLSRHGVFFESATPFELGERIQLVLPYDRTGASASWTARVVRVEPRGGFYGVAAAYERVACGFPA